MAYQPAIEATAARLARRYSLDASWADDVVQSILMKLPRIAKGATVRRSQIDEDVAAGGSDGANAANSAGNGDAPFAQPRGFTFRAYVSSAIRHALIDALKKENRYVLLEPGALESSTANAAAGSSTSPGGASALRSSSAAFATELPPLLEEAEWARCVIHQALTAMRDACEANNHAARWGVFDAKVVGPILRGEEGESYDDLVIRYGLKSTVQAHSLLQTAKRTYLRHLREAVARTVEDPSQVEREIQALAEVLSRDAARSDPGFSDPIESVHPHGASP